MSTVALVLAFAVSHTAANIVLFLLVAAAALESIFAYCVGCRIFAVLMGLGLIPQSVCAECADLSPRLGVRAG